MEDKKLFEKRWLLAQKEQKKRYLKIIDDYKHIEWSDKEKVYLLWLCYLDINTLEAFEDIFEKLQNSNIK